jgi:UPF0716 protein FxsA
MALAILLALLALPFVEIAVFIRVGEWIGIWPTIGLTLLSSAVGLQLMRYQGLLTLAKAREAAMRNEPPVEAMLDGLSILLGGFLLIVPGFVTDLVGLLLFIPAVRRRVSGLLWRGLGANERRRRGGAAVIETEYEILDETKVGDSDRPRLEKDKGR